ncbi:hypothetical protein ACTFIR_003839 [Dictyostelium discoideum]
MSTTVNNNDASSSSTSASNNAESFDLRMKSMEDQINNLSLAFTRFMKEPMFSSNTNSRSQRPHDDSDTENEQSDDESSNNVNVPTDYQLSDTLLCQYKHMVNNQGLLVEEECILKKDEISELNKMFNFPSNFQVNVTPEDGLKPLLLMSSMVSSDSSNVDVELISYLAQSAIVLAVNAQASLSRVRQIYGSEVLLPIKIKDTPKMFDETETERVRKLAKSIRKNNEAKQSLLKLNYHYKPNSNNSDNSSSNNTTGNSNKSKSNSVELISYFAQSAIILAVNAQASLSRVRRNNIAKEIYGFEVLLPITIKDTPKMFDETEIEHNSSSNNTTGNSNKSKSNSGSNGRSNNFNGSPSNVASGRKNTKSANLTSNRFQKNKK